MSKVVMTEIISLSEVLYPQVRVINGYERMIELYYVRHSEERKSEVKALCKALGKLMRGDSIYKGLSEIHLTREEVRSVLRGLKVYVYLDMLGDSREAEVLRYIFYHKREGIFTVSELVYALPHVSGYMPRVMQFLDDLGYVDMVSMGVYRFSGLLYIKKLR